MAASATLFAERFSEDPWWWGDAPPVAYDAHPPTGSDVVVVGGGYAGLSCATELALAGRSVTVLDIRRIGEGASGRNAGLVSGRAGLSKMIDLESYVGPDRAAAILDEADEAYVHFQHLVDEHAPGAFQDRGRFVAARSKAAFRTLEKKYEEYRDSGEGSGVTLIQPGDEGRYVTTDAFHGGMAASAAGLAHPAVFIDGLRRRAEAAGVSIHTGIRVTDIDSSGVGPHTITVASGSGTARATADRCRRCRDRHQRLHRSGRAVASGTHRPDVVDDPGTRTTWSGTGRGAPPGDDRRDRHQPGDRLRPSHPGW